MTTTHELPAPAAGPAPTWPAGGGPAALLGLVAASGPAALPALLSAGLAWCGAAALVVRDPAGEVLAVLGVPTAALPLPRTVARAEHVEVRALAVAGRPVGSLAVHAPAGPLPVGLVEALAVALALPDTDAATLLAEADAERDVLADALHDGVLQTLVTARYAADLARRDEAAAPQVAPRVQAALGELRERVWRLRPRTGEPLPDLLHALARRAGGRLDVDTSGVTPGSAADPGAEAFAYRVCVVALDTVDGPLTARLGSGGGGLVLALRTSSHADAVRVASGCARRAAALAVGIDTPGAELLLRLPALHPLDPAVGPVPRTARQTGTDQ